MLLFSILIVVFYVSCIVDFSSVVFKFNYQCSQVYIIARCTLVTFISLLILLCVALLADSKLQEYKKEKEIIKILSNFKRY